MVTNENMSRPPDAAKSDPGRLKKTVDKELSSAREEAEKAGAALSESASRIASDVRDQAVETLDSGRSQVASSLGDFTAAIKKASDELGNRDQSMAANLVREAASGLEQVSGAIEGKNIQELTRSVSGFARRQPAAFLIGAALAGIAIGRFAKASAEHDDGDYIGASKARYGAGRDHVPDEGHSDSSRRSSSSAPAGSFRTDASIGSGSTAETKGKGSTASSESASGERTPSTSDASTPKDPGSSSLSGDAPGASAARGAQDKGSQP